MTHVFTNCSHSLNYFDFHNIFQKEVAMVEKASEDNGSCECCESGGWWSWQPGNPECGGCGHSYSSHSGS